MKIRHPLAKFLCTMAIIGWLVELQDEQGGSLYRRNVYGYIPGAVNLANRVNEWNEAVDQRFGYPYTRRAKRAVLKPILSGGR